MEGISLCVQFPCRTGAVYLFIYLFFGDEACETLMQDEACEALMRDEACEASPT